MIDTSSIRCKVLEMAMHGKLSERKSTDSSSIELYESILQKKRKLIKEGLVRKDGKLEDAVEEYEIPDKWIWVNFGAIITLQSGQDLSAAEYNSSNIGIPYMTGASNFREDGGLIVNRWTNTPKAYARRGDILISCKGTVGKLTILDEKEVHIARQIMGIKTYLIDTEFAKFFVESGIEKIKAASKGLIPGIERNDILGLNCPLPPIEEQRRIVKRITEIFNLLQIIDELQKTYFADIEILKSKLIDAGIQGKLKEQLPEDGTAEELYAGIQEKKAKIIESGILKGRKNKKVNNVVDADGLFAIPNNWKWIRLGDVCEIFGRIGFRGYTKADIVEAHEGAITISPSNIDGNGNMHFEECTYLSWFKYEESPEIQIENEDIIIVKTGSSYGKAGIVKNLPEKATINPQLAVLKYVYCNKDYLNYVLNCSSSRKQYEQFVIGAAIPTFSQEKLANLLIPLPPLAEQKRIVDKIQEILAII